MILYVIGRQKWTVLAVCNESGDDCQVLDVLEGAGRHGEALLARLRENVSERGPGYNEEFSKHLRDKIFEFKRPAKKGGTLRVLYFYDAGYVVVCACAELKKANKTSDQLIDRAIAIRGLYVAAKTIGDLEFIEEFCNDPN